MASTCGAAALLLALFLWRRGSGLYKAHRFSALTSNAVDQLFIQCLESITARGASDAEFLIGDLLGDFT